MGKVQRKEVIVPSIRGLIRGGDRPSAVEVECAVDQSALLAPSLTDVTWTVLPLVETPVHVILVVVRHWHSGRGQRR